MDLPNETNGTPPTRRELGRRVAVSDPRVRLGYDGGRGPKLRGDRGRVGSGDRTQTSDERGGHGFWNGNEVGTPVTLVARKEQDGKSQGLQPSTPGSKTKEICLERPVKDSILIQLLFVSPDPP